MLFIKNHYYLNKLPLIQKNIFVDYKTIDKKHFSLMYNETAYLSTVYSIKYLPEGLLQIVTFY